MSKTKNAGKKARLTADDRQRAKLVATKVAAYFVEQSGCYMSEALIQLFLMEFGAMIRPFKNLHENDLL